MLLKSLSLVDLMSAQKVYGQDFRINNIIINAFTKIYFLILNHNKSDKHSILAYKESSIIIIHLVATKN